MNNQHKLAKFHFRCTSDPWSKISNLLLNIYPPPSMKLRKGNVFTGVSFCPQDGVSSWGRVGISGPKSLLEEGVGIPRGRYPGDRYTWGGVGVPRGRYTQGSRYIPIPPYWHLVAATKTCIVGKRAICILLECFLVQFLNVSRRLKYKFWWLI